MTSKQFFFSSSLVLISLVAFYLVGIRYLPKDLHFKFQMLFIPTAFFFLLIELIRARLAQSFERSALKYMKLMNRVDQRVLEEIPQTNPLFEFYTLLIQLMEKYSGNRVEEKASASQYLMSSLKVLQEDHGDSEGTAKAYLDELSRYFPDAELYVFLVGNQKIYRISSLNGETPQGDPSKPYSFSILTDFSGKAYQEGIPVLSNDFKSDPNLGQFLSRENPNIPIYGAVFPLKDGDQVRGFLWIRDSAQTIDHIKSEMDAFLLMVNLLSTKLICSTPNFTLSLPDRVSIYPHFETQAKYIYEHSKVQKSPFTLVLLYAKWFQESKSHEGFILDQIREKIPAPAIYTREDHLYYIAIDGHDRKSIMLASAKLLDRLVKYASIEHGDSPIGEVNLGIYLNPVSHDGPGFRECLKQAHDLLKESISSGSNQLRISPELGEEHEQEA